VTGRTRRWPRLAAALAASATLAACAVVTPAPELAGLPAWPSGGLELYAVGDIADCRRQPPAKTAAARTAQQVPAGATVLALGDMAYQYADAATLASCYEPTWGRHRASTLVAPGNHDYVGGSAAALVEYFGMAPPQAPGFLATQRRFGDDWLLLTLDSNVQGAALQAQLDWLQRTLAAARSGAPACLLVAWHAPLYSSGFHRGSGSHMQPFWQLLDGYGADLVLSGHEHFYERFEPRDATGGAAAAGEGMRQFVVGTGGARLFGFWKPPYRSSSRVLEHGVLRLSLGQGAYAWRFVDVDGRVRDAGEARCRRAVN
jgi:acid phosphatase type 7